MKIVCLDCGDTSEVSSLHDPKRFFTCQVCSGSARASSPKATVQAVKQTGAPSAPYSAANLITSGSKPKKTTAYKRSQSDNKSKAGGYKSVGALKRALSAARSGRAEKAAAAHKVSGLGSAVFKVVSGGAVRQK